MFSFITLASAQPAVKVNPEDIPPPTAVKFPRWMPQEQQGSSANLPARLVPFLQRIHRPSDLRPEHLAALGVHVTPDASPDQVIPDPSYRPDFEAWDGLSADEAREKNESTRCRMYTDGLSPGCQVYLDRKRELSYPNQAAFRTVRRLGHPKGQQPPKLGTSYDFWRCLEIMTVYYDDPTEPPRPPPKPAAKESVLSPKPSASEKSADEPVGAKPPLPGKPQDDEEERPTSYRTKNADSMPVDCVRHLVTSFIKLVAYEFACTVSPSRLEPRLHMASAPPGDGERRCSSISSICSFVFRSPTTRAAARAGIHSGPVAGISVRMAVHFESEFDNVMDLTREVVSALVTAQHRSREGRKEKKFGEGEWWTSRARWGGGPGGPIGREVEKDGVPGDKDAASSEPETSTAPASAARTSTTARKNLSMYDNYRMVRPPAACWDAKTVYEAVGKAKGADHDDVFILSSLFHHISVVRVRVPNRLLEVLEGAAETTPKSWGGVEVWRSPWYDLFAVEDRISALQLIWGVMSYLMRKETSGDVAMGGC